VTLLRRLFHRVIRRLGLAVAVRDELRRDFQREIAQVRGEVKSVAARLRERPSSNAPASRDVEERLARELEIRVSALSEPLADIGRKVDARGLETQAAIVALQEQLTRLTRAYAVDAEQLDRLATVARWEVDRIASHVRHAVEEATLHVDPFPHLIVDGLLPPDAFDVLLESIPPEEFFEGSDPKRLDLKGPDRSILPVASKAIWGSFSRDIIAGVLGPAVAQRFRPIARDFLRLSVGEQFVDEALALPLQTRGLRLMLRRPGWKLAPHLDPRDQFITTLLYLAHPGDPEAYGTQLFRVDRENFVASWANTYYPEAEGLRCELVKTLPFRGNLCLSFLNLGGGAHGAELPADAQPADMRRLAFQFYMGPERDALNALIDRLPAELQVAWTRRVKKGDRERLRQESGGGDQSFAPRGD
jgi:hypothetical protein